MAALPRRATPPRPTAGFDLLARFRANGDAAFAFAVFGMVAVMMVPIPPFLLDMMLAASITVSLLVFLVALYTGGVVFYIDKRRTWTHPVWHLFVLGGSVCHYFAVLFYANPSHG